MVSASSGPLAVALHNGSAPSDEEWADWMAIVHRIPLGTLRILVFTDGGAPTTLQRGRFTDYLAGQAVHISVVSSSRLVRSVATAISWFNPEIRVFPPVEIDQAFAHVGLTGAGPDKLLASLVVAARGIEGGSPKVFTEVLAARNTAPGGTQTR
jgi:hypothetical protein